MAFIVASIIGGGIALVGGVSKLIMAGQGARDRKNEQAAAKAEMKKMKNEYKNLDTSNLAAGVRNPYQNLENTMEDLTVNQQQAQFEAQQGQQSRANIMQGLQGAAGSSGIAGLAQSLANQGMLQSQKASASIGLQEAQNQRAAAQQAAQNQQLEGRGEMWAEGTRQQGAEAGRGLEWQKTSTMYGMSQQRTATANEAIRQQKADQMAAVGEMAQAGTQIATAGMKIPKLPDQVDEVATATKSITNMQMDPNQITNREITTTDPFAANSANIIGGVGTTNYGYGFGQTPPPSPYQKKKNLKINKYK